MVNSCIVRGNPQKFPLASPSVGSDMICACTKVVFADMILCMHKYSVVCCV